MDIYDVAVVGAGPAGSMAAIRSSQLKKNVIVIERNGVIGKKILLTGNGRCNITNTAPIEVFIKNFGKQGMFLKPAFFAFRNHNLIQFFETQGLNFTIEDRGRVFPVTNNAFSVARALREYMVKNKVEISYNARVVKLERKDNLFQLVLDRSDNHMIYAEKVILATGGASLFQNRIIR